MPRGPLSPRSTAESAATAASAPAAGPVDGLSSAELGLATVPGLLTLCLGGFGQMVGAFLILLEAAQGRALSVFGIDNASIVQPDLLLPDGRRVRFPLDRWLRLVDAVPRRTILLGHEILKERYLRSGLLASLPVSFHDACAGNGGGAWPINSLLDLEEHIAAVRTHIRKALLAAAQTVAEAGDALDRHLGQEVAAPGPMTVLVVAGGCGSFGAGTCALAPYLIRDEARKLNMARPRVWLLLGGPHAFRGLTPRSLLSYGTTMQTLQHLSERGLEEPWRFIDGTVLPASGEPPVERLFLFDEPERETLPLDRAAPSDSELQAFAGRAALAAQLLLAPETRDAFLDHVAMPTNREGVWSGLTTLGVGVGGVDRALLERLLAARLAVGQAAAVRAMLAAS